MINKFHIRRVLSEACFYHQIDDIKPAAHAGQDFEIVIIVSGRKDCRGIPHKLCITSQGVYWISWAAFFQLQK